MVWNISHAVLGMIATIAIQRALFKLLIACFLSTEFKHDETNRAWWTGKWYGRKLGAHAWSQPVQEFIFKIVEMSLFSADLLTCHFVLIILSVPLLIPFSNRSHLTMLFWLRPSKQIRPPIFLFKQIAQRRKIVATYGVFYAIIIGSLITFIVSFSFLRASWST
ncbi:family 48 glycosyltransferase [Melampsora larici-populina 98AG31]|uniref:Family 48 glycosyltransferase n=1 Tax=Melampsora larici-populina (strain 98AG31 / pathotype 3-4-7) TaxID=747676 RepID=F4RPF7_MELLP|nr:family 48 glycosyltransferase [Melampsora larici-populina 98AG31]EGG05519.1 family 48 glycosyltransferase [Melampsora larici-populina 98AG31]